MREFMARILNALTAALFRNAERLARLAAVRRVASEYEAAYAEAAVLEAAGKVRLADALRRELDEALDGGAAVDGGEAMRLSLNGTGGSDPFALPGPKASGGAEPLAGAGEAAEAKGEPTPRRRGRPPGRTSSGRKSKTKRAKRTEAMAVEAMDGQASTTSSKGD